MNDEPSGRQERPVEAVVGRILAIAKDGRWLPGTVELQMVGALAEMHGEIERLREFAQWLLEAYHSNEGMPEAKVIAREARAVLTPNAS